LAQQLLELEGEKITVVSKDDQIISDADLDALLDRSPEVFTTRSVGWTSKDASTGGVKSRKSKGGENAAFEVYNQQLDEASEGLAKLMGENADNEDEN
jgi:ATP-dependent DNA helicase